MSKKSSGAKESRSFLTHIAVSENTEAELHIKSNKGLCGLG
jgi:hypothetical protein